MAPPDVPSQCIMAALLLFLFEISLFFVKLVEPKYEDEAEEAATAEQKDQENA